MKTPLRWLPISLLSLTQTALHRLRTFDPVIVAVIAAATW